MMSNVIYDLKPQSYPQQTAAQKTCREWAIDARCLAAAAQVDKYSNKQARYNSPLCEQFFCRLHSVRIIGCVVADIIDILVSTNKNISYSSK